MARVSYDELIECERAAVKASLQARTDRVRQECEDTLGRVWREHTWLVLGGSATAGALLAFNGPRLPALLSPRLLATIVPLARTVAGF